MRAVFVHCAGIGVTAQKLVLFSGTKVSYVL
jgi:hypothetical protein